MTPRTEGPRLVIREYEPGDEGAILEGFNRAFAALDPGFHPRTMEEWEWRYRHNPAGWRIWIAVTPEGRVVGQQAGMPVHVIHDGRAATWNQVGDTFVDAEAARGLRSLFRDVAQPFSDGYGGPPPDQDPVLFGMPIRRALRIGAKQLAYQVVRSQNKLMVAPDRLRVLAEPARIDVAEVERFPEETAVLARRLADAHAGVAVRDARYLDWRFVARPDARYARAVARRGAEVAGIAVYRPGVFDQREDGLICDFAATPGDEAAADALRAWLRDRALGDGVERLTGVLPETCDAWIAFQRAGFRVHPTGYYLVGRCYAGPYDMAWLYRNWYYTLGDFDLC